MIERAREIARRIKVSRDFSDYMVLIMDLLDLLSTDLRRQFGVLLEAFGKMREANQQLMDACRGAIDGLHQLDRERDTPDA